MPIPGFVIMPNPSPLQLLVLLVAISLALPTPLGFTLPASTRTDVCISIIARRRAPRCVAALPFLTTPTPVSPSAPLLTQEDIDACAASFGLELRLSSLGPFYRIIARVIGDAEGSEPIAYTSGFVAPLFKLVHLDTMEVTRERGLQRRVGKSESPVSIVGVCQKYVHASL